MTALWVRFQLVFLGRQKAASAERIAQANADAAAPAAKAKVEVFIDPNDQEDELPRAESSSADSLPRLESHSSGFSMQAPRSGNPAPLPAPSPPSIPPRPSRMSSTRQQQQGPLAQLCFSHEAKAE